jgi:LacI family transcriptional regulator
VLHGSGKGNIRVGEATRARIVAAARELGFIVNPLARSLATGRTGVLGVVLPFASALINQDPFCMLLLRGVTEELVRSGYDLLLNTSIGDTWEDVEPQRLVDSRVDGLVVVAPPVAHPLVDFCATRGIPCVPVVYPANDDRICTVNADDFEGGRLAAEHLLRLGHRRIFHLAGPPTIASSLPRRDGFLTALEAAGVPGPDEWIVPAGFDWKDGYDATNRILEQPRETWPTAIFAVNDLCATGVLRALAERDVSVPGEISVIGFEDTSLCLRADPPLTAVHVPVSTMGTLAASLVIAQAQKRDIASRHAVLPVSLAVRGSTAPPRS